jgi:nitroreductase
VLPLTPDELLSTTRAVRRRLDLTRPVEEHVLDDCLRLAQQAPSAGNRQPFHFVVVRDATLRGRIGALYHELAEEYLPRPETIEDAARRRVYSSAWYLAERLQDVPVHVFPCVEWRDAPGPGQWASVIQAAWSFMLAARSRALGTAWVGMVVRRERPFAELLDIPEDVRIAALVPVAYTVGTEFKPGVRHPLAAMVHRDRW